MTKTALFVIGPPGVGKTTAIRALVPELAPDSALTRTEIEKPKWTVCGTTVLAGHYHGQTFDGGDTVPYAGAREALEYWREQLLPFAELTIFDGDRFSTEPSLQFIKDSGVRIVGVHLVAHDDVRRARCAQRGSNQNETWIRGRITKARNFAFKIGAHHLDAGANPPANVAAQIQAVLV